MIVDLDAEAGKTSTMTHYFQIRQTKTVRLQYLHAYLKKEASWDSHVLECMSEFVVCLQGTRKQ
jgi:hypothetical protein